MGQYRIHLLSCEKMTLTPGTPVSVHRVPKANLKFSTRSHKTSSWNPQKQPAITAHLPETPIFQPGTCPHQAGISRFLRGIRGFLVGTCRFLLGTLRFLTGIMRCVLQTCGFQDEKSHRPAEMPTNPLFSRFPTKQPSSPDRESKEISGRVPRSGPSHRSPGEAPAAKGASQAVETSSRTTATP